MSKLTRGNVLAVLKELKKHQRPRTATQLVAVQAICPQKAKRVDKRVDMNATLERRRVMFGNTMSIVPYYTPAEYTQFVLEYEAFVQAYIKNKKPTNEVLVDKNAAEDLSNRSRPAD